MSSAKGKGIVTGTRTAAHNKTRECRFFQSGTCNRGDRCTFLHTVATVQPRADGSSANLNSTQENQKIEGVANANANTPGAGAGSITGRTRRGRKKNGGNPTERPETNSSPVPRGNAGSTAQAVQATQQGPKFSSLKPCSYWRAGSCHKGDRCAFSHDPKIRQDELNRLAQLASAERQRAEEQRAAEEQLRKEREAQEAEQRERERAEAIERLAEAARERERLEQERRRKEKEEEERKAQLARDRAAQREAQRRERERLERVAREEELRKKREAEAAAARERNRLEQERKKKEKEEREAREKEAREKALRQRREREAASTLQLVLGGSNLVTFGAGFETRTIIPGFDLCSIVVKNLALKARKADVVRLFAEEFQMDTARFTVSEIRFDSGSQKAVVLMRVEEARAIQTVVQADSVEFGDRQLQFEVGANALWGTMNSTTNAGELDILTIYWPKPSRVMIATYPVLETAQRKARELNGISLEGRKIKVVMNMRPAGPASRYFDPASIKITNIAPGTATWTLVERVGTHQIREIKSCSYDLETCASQLEARLYNYRAVRGSFQMTAEESRMRAKVRFASHEDAQRASKAIADGLFGTYPAVPGYRAVLPAGHQYTISIIREQYSAQKKRWDEMAGGKGEGGNAAFIRINESKNGRMYIKVLGSNQKEVGALKVRVESLVAGERLGSEHWHSSFTNVQGGSFLNRVVSETGVYVSIDRKVLALRLFGGNDNMEAARDMIGDEVERLNFLEWSVPLPREAVGFFMRSGLKTLQEALGEENVSLDLGSSPAIKIKGGDDARHHLKKLMDEVVVKLRNGSLAQEGGGTGETCPICYDDVTVPDIISCGHTYCESCLRHYLISAVDSKKFPLVCVGDEATCGSPIAIPIIQRYLTPQRFNRLVDVAFLAYLERNPRKFKYCTTPDCTQIYQADNGKDLHQCPSCFSKICGSCNEEAHDGMRCEEARVHRNPAEQERLNSEWAARNNVKKCPRCSVMMMKSEGCNHMVCPCGAHICWRCLAVYETSGEVYNHMTSAHGGFYEEPPVPAPVIPVHRFWGADPLNAPPVQIQIQPDQRLAQVERDRALAQRLMLLDLEAERLGRERVAEDVRRRERARMLIQRQQEQVMEERRRQQLLEEMNRHREAEARARRESTKEGGWCVVM
ncbi:hypothetical protein FA15DRAFT_697025 [Coprinopsis marcescibilis]|uniref:Uncharacterized protein n=1 Tax=Coprinopsis marcescibilis TaxID=230819 RepID=A0A5C3KJJ3_COPMA|nr:hypothetical protein FA15DRAFT_697025 [Coprinopsis marcescibilis]